MREKVATLSVLTAVSAGLVACQHTSNIPAYAEVEAVTCEDPTPIRERQCTGEWLDPRVDELYSFDVTLTERCSGVWDFAYLPPEGKDIPSEKQGVTQTADGHLQFPDVQPPDGTVNVRIAEVGGAVPNLSYQFTDDGYGQNSDLTCTDTDIQTSPEVSDRVRGDCTAGVALLVEDGTPTAAYCADEPAVVGRYDPETYSPWVVYFETEAEPVE